MSLTDPGRGDRSSQVVEALRRRGGEATSAQIAEDLGLHPSTARFHLDHLVAEGRAETRRQERTTRGRPHTIFRLVAGPDDGPRAYQLLASILVDAVAREEDPAEAGLRAGRAWGRRRGGGLDDVLDEMGFAPTREGDVITLRHCPFLDLATAQPRVVCALHRGVIEGVAGIPAQLEAHPGSTCRVRLEATATEPRTTPGSPGENGAAPGSTPRG